LCLSDLIDDYLRRDEKPLPIDEIHPHEIGLCFRHNYYKRLDPRPTPKNKLRLFKSADFAHAFIRDVLGSTPKVTLVGSEKPFSMPFDGFKIVGRYDDLITVKLAGKDLPVLIEVKSVSGKTVEHIRHVKPHHLYQIHPYMMANKTPLGVAWYIARDTFADRNFSVFYDQAIMNESVMRAQVLHQHLADNRLPPPEARTSRDIKFLCWLCPWWRECQREYNPKR